MYFHLSAPSPSVETYNDIVRHPRLSGTAKSLLQWALSLPSDTDETLQSIGEQMPEGRAAVSRARQQLIAEGYVHVRREQLAGTGRWVSRVLVSRLPVTDPEDIEAAWKVALGGGVSGVSAGVPTAGISASRDVGPQTQEVTTGEKPNPPAGDDQKPDADDDDEPPSGGGGGTASCEPAEGSEHTRRAVRFLSGLIDRDRRLRLGVTEVMKLAGLVSEWLARGVAEQELSTALVSGLPERIISPVGLLRNRLERKMPPLPEPKPPAPERHECGRCRVPVPRPGICRPCAGLPEPAADRDRESLAEVTLRGVAKARAAMGTAVGRAPGGQCAPGR